MTTREIQDEILRLKKEKEVCILAHAYQNHEILEVADYMGDSFALSQQAAKTQEQTILMCGVRFMAETVKVLSPDKKVLLSSGEAGCPMAEQIPEKTFKFIKGGCPTHLRMGKADVAKAKKAHPNAKLLVHPECAAAVTKNADYIGSTTGIMSYAKKSTDKEFIIGTENSIVSHLQYECPDKLFYPLSKDCVCHNMKLTTLVDVYNCLKGLAGEEIILPEEVSKGAKRCIDRMLELN